MFGRIMPREGRFFELFNQHAEQAVQASRELAALMANLGELESRARNIETCEKRADKITHETIDLLHKTFITPLDREEIHKLITTMDDILDLMEDAAQSIYLYDIKVVTADAKQLADICVGCCDRVKTAVALLNNMSNAQGIMKICEEIDRLESDADRVMRAAMSRLFRDEADVRQLIKLKAIYETLEAVTDRCEDVANLIEGIILENG
jgi:predicted phosphate transport protein (TIGR00153 family)